MLASRLHQIWRFSVWACAHFQPIQFFFQPVKRIVANLARLTHFGDRGARGDHGLAAQCGVRGAGERRHASAMRGAREQVFVFVTDRLRGRRVVALKRGERRADGAFARLVRFASDRIVIPEFEELQERLQRRGPESPACRSPR